MHALRKVSLAPRVTQAPSLGNSRGRGKIFPEASTCRVVHKSVQKHKLVVLRSSASDERSEDLGAGLCEEG